ncbi:hypothetical protein BpHYR1_002631 [Brachionus plicatilis]|uniref:Uncharacterized protein n=1 Tax=Brachionus plicatilis TaxID=10195 RepID=A0A3M7QR58_BRAPC|nr:hypothetical protein BpHYR1_002631 [Brachionus plicatilis]
MDVSAEFLAVFGESECDSDGELIIDTKTKVMDDTVFIAGMCIKYFNRIFNTKVNGPYF